MRTRGRRRTPSHLRMRTRGRRRTPSHLRMRTRGEAKDALAPQDEDAGKRRTLISHGEVKPKKRLLMPQDGRISRLPFRLILRCARPSTTAVLILRCEGEA